MLVPEIGRPEGVHRARFALVRRLAGRDRAGLDPAGPIAREQDNLWNIVFPIAVVVFVFVQAANCLGGLGCLRMIKTARHVFVDIPGWLDLSDDDHGEDPLGKGRQRTLFELAALCRTAAVKILPPHAINDPAAVVRFQREARALAKLTHGGFAPSTSTSTEDDTASPTS
jgi:hypothetical protein